MFAVRFDFHLSFSISLLFCRNIFQLTLFSVFCRVQEHGGEPIIPFSCVLERNLADMPPDEAAKYCEENKVQRFVQKCHLSYDYWIKCKCWIIVHVFHGFGNMRGYSALFYFLLYRILYQPCTENYNTVRSSKRKMWSNIIWKENKI